MKKSIILSVIASCIIATPLYASNRCIDDIDHHLFEQTFFFMGNCGLQDRDMPRVKEFIDAHPDIEYVFLYNNNIGPAGAKILAQTTTHIDQLVLDVNHIGDEGAKALAKMSSLAFLDLDNNYIGAKGAAALAKASVFWLNLSENDLQDEGAIAFASTEIPYVMLSNNNIGPIGVTALANNNNITGLAVDGNTIDRTALTALLSRNNYGILDFNYNGLSSDDLNKIAAMPNLEFLGLGNSNLDENGVAILTKSSSITMLFLPNNNIGSTGLRYLSQYMGLMALMADNNSFDDAAIADFAANTKTYYLSMVNTGMRDEGAIAMSKNMEIKFLDVRHNDIGPRGIEALRNREDLIVAVEDGDVFLKADQKALKHAKFQGFSAGHLTPAIIGK